MKRHILIGVILLAVCLPLIFPYFSPGYHDTDDGLWAIMRTAEMHRELKDLQIPPRWSSYLNHGFGYPLFLYTYQFPFYISELFNLSGFGAVNATKAVFVISILGAAFGMFILGQSLWGSWGGIFAAVLYLYAPYHLVDLYYRGNIGESLAFALFPLVFYWFRKIILEKTFRSVLITGVIVGILIVTHNASASLLFPFLFLWSCLLIYSKALNKKRALIFCGCALMIGFSVSAYLWLPALFEKKYIALSSIPLADKASHVLNVSEILGFTLHNDRLPYHVPFLYVALALAGLIFSWSWKKNRIYTVGLCLLGLLALSLLLPQSLSIWKIPILKEIDFPWRTFIVSSFLISLAGGSITRLKYSKLIIICVSIFVILTYSRYIRTQPKVYQPDSYFIENDATTTSADELQPIWVTSPAKNRPEQKILLTSGAYQLVSDTSDALEAKVQVAHPENIIVNALFFPGWKAYVDHTPVTIVQTPATGLMQIAVPEGMHVLQLYFERTPIRLFADLLTVGTVIIIICLWILPRKFFHFS